MKIATITCLLIICLTFTATAQKDQPAFGKIDKADFTTFIIKFDFHVLRLIHLF